jgi:hypothetical protein
VADIDQLLGGSLGAAYARCAETGGPFYDYARFALEDGPATLFERLVLPLSADGALVTHLFGMAVFSDVAPRDAGPGGAG